MDFVIAGMLQVLAVETANCECQGETGDMQHCEEEVAGGEANEAHLGDVLFLESCVWGD